MYPTKQNVRYVSENAVQAIDGETAYGLDASKPSIKIKITQRIPQSITVSLGFRARQEGVESELVKSTDFSGMSIRLKDGKIAQLVDGDGDDVVDNDLRVESLSDISVDEFTNMLISGAIQLTEGVHRTVGNDLQTTEGLTYVKFDHRGLHPRKINLGFIKGQEPNDTKVLGPYQFPKYTVLGFNRSLDYKVLAATAGGTPTTTILEFYYTNHANMPEALERQLLRSGSNA